MLKRLTGCSLLEGLTLHGDPDDHYFMSIDGVVAALIPFEQWVKQNIPPDSIVIDAGANIGVTSLLLSRAVPNGHVHAFESMPKNCEFLRRTMELNSILNCTVNESALGSEAGRVYVIGEGSASHVDAITPPGLHGVTEVNMTSIDNYMSDMSQSKLDFMKVDVEGFEPAVLEGASASIAKFQPTIFMEFNTWCLSFVQNFDARAFAELLWKNFDVTSIDSSGRECSAANGDVYRFFHDNVVLHGTVEDVVLRVKPMGNPPSFEHINLALGSAKREGIQVNALRERVSTLEALLEATYGSTSWKLTTPIRMLRKLLQDSGKSSQTTP